MPRLGQSHIVKLDMPSSTKDDPAWVKINLNLDAGTALDASDSDNPTQSVVEAISVMITEWNYAGEDGQVAPVTAENVRKLPMIDFALLAEKIDSVMPAVTGNALETGEKKA